MVSGVVLKRIFELNVNVVEINIEGITQEESLRSIGGANCLNWVLGHILFTRNRIFKLLNQAPFWEGESAQRYERGSENIQQEGESVNIDQIKSLLRQSQEALFKALEALETEDEEQFRKIAFAAFHESYHCGQTGMLRKLIGKEGAIK